MKLTDTITALSLLVICAAAVPTAAQARGNNNSNQALIMNNFSTAEQNISNQISTYVNSGQLSPQQGASFNSELSQISSQAMTASTNGAETMQVMTELNNLTSQINSSLHAPIQYSTVPAYGVANPGFYSNWRNHNYDNFQAQNIARQNNIRAHEMIIEKETNIHAREKINEEKAARQNGALNNTIRAEENNIRAHEMIKEEETNIHAREKINAERHNNAVRVEENNIHAHQVINAEKQQQVINKVKHVEAVEHAENHH